MGLLSSLVSGFAESKPKVPKLKQVDLPSEQLSTTRGNLSAIPDIGALSAASNAIGRGERAKTLSTIPRFSEIENLTSGNITDWLSGRLSDDLAGEVARRSNAKAFAGGYGLSPMAGNLTARDLGLTGLQLQQSAVPMGQQYLANSFGLYGVPELDPASMLVSPMQSAAFKQSQNNAQYQRDLLASKINAQAEPWQQGLMGALDIGEILGMFALL